MDNGTSAADLGPAAPPEQKPGAWSQIGTIVGHATTLDYTFVLRSLQAKVGDIVATRLDVPVGPGGAKDEATVWGRITSIESHNPFFPMEAAQELADQNLDLAATVLSGSRDYLQAEVLVLGTTFGDDPGKRRMSPLTYPVKPSGKVLYPAADDVRRLLSGDEDLTKEPKLRVGSLIARSDVEVALGAKQVVSRHLAILAMTGGGKTVAARRIMRGLIQLRYPLVIFDPHGDYLGFSEKAALFPGSGIRVLFPQIRVSVGNVDVISDLINKMGKRLTDPQMDFYGQIVSEVEVAGNETAAQYIQRLMDVVQARIESRRNGETRGAQEIGAATMRAVHRSLRFVLANLIQMEANNKRLRDQPRFRNYDFIEMPNAMDRPEDIVRPGQVSILYLAGYDHLTQSAIVSIVLEALFHHRSTLNGRIPPFQAVLEEAHNFIPSRQEGAEETPSLPTIRRVITEGRKFGTGLIIISQRPARLDETTLAQCNSFLVLRLVNTKDKAFVRSVMENLSEADANILQGFGPGQGIVSGQAVRFPLLVKIDFDSDLVSTAIGDEDFISEAANWTPDPKRARAEEAYQAYETATEPVDKDDDAAENDGGQAPRSPKRTSRRPPPRRPTRRSAIKPKV